MLRIPSKLRTCRAYRVHTVDFTSAESLRSRLSSFRLRISRMVDGTTSIPKVRGIQDIVVGSRITTSICSTPHRLILLPRSLAIVHIPPASIALHRQEKNRAAMQIRNRRAPEPPQSCLRATMDVVLALCTPNPFPRVAPNPPHRYSVAQPHPFVPLVRFPRFFCRGARSTRSRCSKLATLRDRLARASIVKRKPGHRQGSWSS